MILFFFPQKHQSAFHDGKQPNWFHERCFFVKQRPTTVGDIAGFDSLRMEDQKRITEEISSKSSVIAGPSTSNGGKKGKKRPANDDVKMTDAATKDFGVEYASSSRAECRGCEIKISKGEVRIKKVVYDTEIGIKFDGQALWHHVECFAKVCLVIRYATYNSFYTDDTSSKPKNQYPC